MAGKKISQLDKLTELTGTEIIPVAKDGQNYGVETLFRMREQPPLTTSVITVNYVHPTEVIFRKVYLAN